MDLPATLNIDTRRKAALRQVIFDAVESMDYDDMYCFTLGCRLAINERAGGMTIRDKTLEGYPELMLEGRKLVANFLASEL